MAPLINKALVKAPVWPTNKQGPCEGAGQVWPTNKQYHRWAGVAKLCQGIPTSDPV
jgi:hypothetical protein